MDIDLTALTDEDLTGLYRDVLREQERRRRLVDAPALAAQISADYLAARDGAQPTQDEETLADTSAWPAWVQPTGAHDAYPAGWIVEHEGALWRSTKPANVWAPGTAGLWEKITAGQAGDPPATPDAPDWAIGVAYEIDDLVTYQGVVYRCVQAHVSQAGWEPSSVPALWTPAS